MKLERHQRVEFEELVTKYASMFFFLAQMMYYQRLITPKTKSVHQSEHYPYHRQRKTMVQFEWKHFVCLQPLPSEKIKKKKCMQFSKGTKKLETDIIELKQQNQKPKKLLQLYSRFKKVDFNFKMKKMKIGRYLFKNSLYSALLELE